jgi:hypothetical protein
MIFMFFRISPSAVSSRASTEERLDADAHINPESTTHKIMADPAPISSVSERPRSASLPYPPPGTHASFVGGKKKANKGRWHGGGCEKLLKERRLLLLLFFCGCSRVLGLC